MLLEGFWEIQSAFDLTLLNHVLEYVAEVRKLANEKKTTAKRALDILEIALPIFIHACDMSENDAKLSDEVASLQEEFEKTKTEMLECQVEFEMEKRAVKLKHSKDLLRMSQRFCYSKIIYYVHL